MKVAVVFGGESMEREVSAASAAEVVSALRSRGHEVLAFEADRGLLDAAAERDLLAGRIDARPPAQVEEGALPVRLETGDLRDCDVVFIAMHGGSGENGTIQALLDLAGVCYTGSGKLGSALGMDKDVSKRLFLAAGVPTPAWLMAPATAEAVERELGFPVIVKPNDQGSTVGLSLVQNAEALQAAIDLASQFSNEVMIETYIAGRELTVGILDGTPLPVGEIVPAKGSIFDYEAKYQAGAAAEIFPADIDPEIAERASELALMAAQALKLECYCRVDFRMDANEDLWCLEVNSLPGLTRGSLLPRAAAAVGLEFTELCERICESALQKRSARPLGPKSS